METAVPLSDEMLPLALVQGHAAEGQRNVAGGRRLRALLVTDIVGSTEHLVRQGDRSWCDVLDRHEACARHHITACGGQLVRTTGDGVLATFELPSSAISCALALRDALGEWGLSVRSGIHACELEHHGDDVTGIAVHIADRLSALVGPGEVLVSRTVADLVIGSGVGLDDRGERLFAVADIPRELTNASGQ